MPWGLVSTCGGVSEGTAGVAAGAGVVVESSAHRTEVGGQTKHGQKGLWPLKHQASLCVYGTPTPYLR